VIGHPNGVALAKKQRRRGSGRIGQAHFYAKAFRDEQE
jgi:hypothetical protein